MAPYFLRVVFGLLYSSYLSGNKVLTNLVQKIRSSIWISWFLEFAGLGIVFFVLWLFLALIKEEANYPYKSLNKIVIGIDFAILSLPSLAGSKALVESILSSTFWGL